MEQPVPPVDWRDSLKLSAIVFILLVVVFFNPLVVVLFFWGNAWAHQFDYPGPGIYATLAELTSFFVAGFLLLDIPLLLIRHRGRKRTDSYNLPPVFMTAFCLAAIPVLLICEQARIRIDEEGVKAASRRDYEAMKARLRDPAAILTLPRDFLSTGQARALGERLAQNDVTAEELHAALSAHDSEEVEFGLASNPNADADDLVKIAKQRSGPRSARSQMAVANNPHTPGDVRRSLLGPAYSSCDPEYLYTLWIFHSKEPDILPGLAENPCTPGYVYTMLKYAPYSKQIRDIAAASQERRLRNSKEEKRSADWNPKSSRNPF
jgi:hypothetical protein